MKMPESCNSLSVNDQSPDRNVKPNSCVWLSSIANTGATGHDPPSPNAHLDSMLPKRRSVPRASTCAPDPRDIVHCGVEHNAKVAPPCVSSHVDVNIEPGFSASVPPGSIWGPK